MWQEDLIHAWPCETLLVEMRSRSGIFTRRFSLAGWAVCWLVGALSLSALLPALHEDLTGHAHHCSIKGPDDPCEHSPTHDHESCGICKLILLTHVSPRPSCSPSGVVLAVLTIEELAFEHALPRSISIVPGIPTRGPPDVVDAVMHAVAHQHL